MEVRELRIGNLTSAGIVNEIQKECFYVHDGESSLKNTWFDIHPIKLTEEWLVKCGFFKRSNPYKWYKLMFNDENQKLFILLEKRELFNNNLIGYNYEESIIKIDYVHQLQNLYFAITGEELINKTIKYEISINKSI